MTTKEVTTKERLHHLVDEIPDADAPTVLRMLEGLRTDDDPVLRSLENAPEDDEPYTEEDRAAVREAREDLRAGRVHSLEEVKKALGL